MLRKVIRTGAACFAVLLVATAFGDTTIYGQNTVPSVSTNKFSYLATENILISGSGFGSGENVTLTINQIGGGLTDGVAGAIGASFSGLSWDPADNIRGTFLLTAAGPAGPQQKVARTIFTVGLQTVADDAGPDDLGGQKDLSFLTIDYGLPGSSRIVTTWGWDDTAWTGGNTGDACTLFDVNSDGDADYSLCVTIGGSPAVYQSTRMYRCGPAPAFFGARSDRCSQPTLVTTPAITSSGSLTTPSHNSDPFAAVAAHGQGNTCGSKTGSFPCVADDTVAALVVQLSDINNQAAKLINICSYPSQEPNSNPSDCVVTPNSGFLTIRKESSPTAGAFTFNTSTNSIGSGAQFAITTTPDGTVFKGDRQFLSFTPTTLGYVREDVPAGWTLSSAGCVIQTGNGGTATGIVDSQAGLGGKGVSNVEIREGLETVCTFVDARDNPSLTLIKSVIEPFNVPGGALNTAWALTATNTTTSVSKTFITGQADQIAPGTYKLAESGGPGSGYTPGNWSCTQVGNGTIQLGGANADELTVVSGVNVSCSITNTAQPATLVVKKAVTNDNGATKLAAAFSFTVSGVAGTFSFDTADANDPGNTLKGQRTLTNLAPGTYTVTETVASATGYTVTYSTATCTNVAIPRGGSATCVIANDDVISTPGASTDQRVVLHDSISLTGVKRGASQQAGNNTITFRLYTSATCDVGGVAAIYTEGPIALNLSNANQTDFTVATVTGYLFDPAAASPQTASFYWRVAYSGDQNNQALTTPCGPGPNGERTAVTLDPK